MWLRRVLTAVWRLITEREAFTHKKQNNIHFATIMKRFIYVTNSDYGGVNLSKDPPVPCSNQPAPRCEQNYTPRYDEGLSARIGGKRKHLLFRQPGSLNDYHFKEHLILPARPARTLPPKPQPWWPALCYRSVHRPKPCPKPRYRGLHFDLTHPVPNETVIRHF